MLESEMSRVKCVFWQGRINSSFGGIKLLFQDDGSRCSMKGDSSMMEDDSEQVRTNSVVHSCSLLHNLLRELKETSQSCGKLSSQAHCDLWDVLLRSWWSTGTLHLFEASASLMRTCSLATPPLLCSCLWLWADANKLFFSLQFASALP